MLANAPMTIQPASLSAFTGGINAADSLANMPPNDMVTCINMDISPSGLSVRKGFEEWCLPMPDFGGVRTIIPYTSRAVDDAENRLFSITSAGIYDCTTRGDTINAPVKVAVFTGTASRAGYASWHSYTGLNAEQTILLCDLENGYWTYNPTVVDPLLQWTKMVAGVAPGEIDGADPDTFDFVNVWKSRCWFVQGESSVAWYTDVGEYTGTVTAFDFGNKFKYGGRLKGVYSYTIDGGDGIDDYLVAISEAGDVLLYRGTNPAAADTFALVGSFYVGSIPKGRRVATEHGGDILITSSFGIVPLSQLISGVASLGDTALTYNIEPLVNNRMETTINDYGWEVKFSPKTRTIILSSPKGSNQLDVQYVYNTTLRAWTIWSVEKAITWETWNNRLYCGRSDGRLMLREGFLDNVLIVPDGDIKPPEPALGISWYFLSSFQDFGSPAQYKMTQMLRAHFITDGDPSYNIEARYDYDITPVNPPARESLAETAGATWDTGPDNLTPPGLPPLGVWDISLWGGRPGAFEAMRGSKGLGHVVAVGMAGLSNRDTGVISIDIMFTAGGLI